MSGKCRACFSRGCRVPGFNIPHQPPSEVSRPGKIRKDRTSVRLLTDQRPYHNTKKTITTKKKTKKTPESALRSRNNTSKAASKPNQAPLALWPKVLPPFRQELAAENPFSQAVGLHGRMISKFGLFGEVLTSYISKLGVKVDFEL